ncbi:MAG TPA: lysophospholipid acyltransferase family protein [Elusimicrobiales bacterium]|nr:lysophospholipid acyltransferase family protein [Elusimicrobiales bacterium]
MPLFKRIKFLLEYALFLATAWLLRSLPLDTARNLGAVLGRAATVVVYKRFRLTVDNIHKAFPAKSPAEAQGIARQSWANMGVTAAEFAHAATLDKKQLLELFSVTNTELFENHLAQGKGAIVHLAHIGNWEIAGLGVQALCGKVAAVARHIRNPYVDAWMDKARRHIGSEIISHRNPFFSCVKWLKKGKVLGILMDQNMPYGEVFLPFFGRMASTTPLTALLALKTGAPIFPLRVYRKDGKINAEFEDPIYPEEGYSDDKVLRLVAVLNARIEAWIAQDPSSWLWAHNRWKREHQAPQASNQPVSTAS